MGLSTASFRSNRRRAAPKAPTKRIFFCTDLHGSEICFRKFLNAARAYEASVLIMGGDCTGKMAVPIYERAVGGWWYELGGRRRELASEEELQHELASIRNHGFYPVRLREDEAAGDRLGELFKDEMLRTLSDWLELAADRLGGTGTRMIVTPGNDDDFDVDDVIHASSFVEAGNDRVLKLDERHEMLSVGFSNPTPWETPRECSEKQLAEKIDALAEQIVDMENAIFNIHVPPYGTGLDFAPELENGMKLKRAGAISKAVGSTAVREAILEYQPLLTLHGHIHESRATQRLGRTLCINPGSCYSDWRLQGVIIDLGDRKVERYVPVTG